MKKKLVSIMLVAAMALSVALHVVHQKETLQRRTEPKQWLPV